jgi:hypothetical protein
MMGAFIAAPRVRASGEVSSFPNTESRIFNDVELIALDKLTCQEEIRDGGACTRYRRPEKGS